MVEVKVSAVTYGAWVIVRMGVAGRVGTHLYEAELDDGSPYRDKLVENVLHRMR